MKKVPQLISTCLILALLLIATPPLPVKADNHSVTNQNNTGPGSLRQAILDADAGDTILFAADYTITLSENILLAKNLTIDGSGHKITISGGNLVQILNISSGTILLKNLTIQDGYSLNGFGGAINNSGTLNIENSTFANNTVTTTSYPNVFGGAIHNFGTLTISNSTFTGNHALNTVDSAAAAEGGAISNFGALTITNSTLSGNSATGSYNPTTAHGGIHGTGTLQNSIVASNTPENCGAVSADAYNLDTDGTCGEAVTKTSAEIKLAALADNGGLTQTMALGAGSAAINAGLPTVCAAAPVNNLDQRGVTRPQGSQCDLGAYEFQFTTIADFDGDGATDISIFRPTNGVWYVKDQFATSWGMSGDIPTPGDYNGDGAADLAVFRPSNGNWYVKDQFSQQWGGAAGDIPVPGDYDGDGATEVTIFRPSTGHWFVMEGSVTTWGLSGDIPIPGDYDGNGTMDVAVYRPSTGEWFVKDQFVTTWGVSGDIPVPGDYNGDGKTDVAMYRPSTGQWFVKDQFATTWGLTDDLPVPGDYDGNGLTDIAVYRPSVGQWYVKNLIATTWGWVVSNDYPVPAPDTNGDGDPYQDAGQ